MPLGVSPSVGCGLCVMGRNYIDQSTLSSPGSSVSGALGLAVISGGVLIGPTLSAIHGYEAQVFIGWDEKRSRYVAHWIDIFGGPYSEPIGYGTHESDDRFILTFDYPDALLRETSPLEPHLVGVEGPGCNRWFAMRHVMSMSQPSAGRQPASRIAIEINTHTDAARAFQRCADVIGHNVSQYHPKNRRGGGEGAEDDVLRRWPPRTGTSDQRSRRDAYHRPIATSARFPDPLTVITVPPPVRFGKTPPSPRGGRPSPLG